MKNIPIYYQKPIVRLGDVEPGTYVFDSEGKLCYVDERHDKHSMYICTTSGLDTPVYPITIETDRIMERVRELRRKYRARIKTLTQLKLLCRGQYIIDPDIINDLKVKI